MLYVSIGRNVGDEPMELYVWEEFQREVKSVVYDLELYVDPDTVAYGVSRYGTMREDTCVMVWLDINAKLSKSTIRALGEVAVKYGQECIAWSVSVTEFVEGVK